MREVVRGCVSVSTCSLRMVGLVSIVRGNVRKEDLPSFRRGVGAHRTT